MPEITYSLDRDSMVATLVIDTAGSVNTIGQQFIADLEKATAQACTDRVKGVILVSAKPKSFLDGANLKEILTGETPQAVRPTVVRYQEALEALARAPFPVLALLNGQTALGGGFELLLWACDHILATPESKVGLPEVGVGLFPAGGGTQTLRKVVGLKTAVDMILSGRIVPASTIPNRDFITVCPAADFKSAALAWPADHQGVVNRNYDPGYKEPDPISPDEEKALFNQARMRYAISPHRPYFSAAIEALEAGSAMPFEAAVRKEVDLFLPLLFNQNSRNKIDLFFLTTSIAPRLVRVDPSKAVKTDRLAVIGAGLMGQGIAQVAAERGMRATLIDVDEDRVKAAVETIDGTLQDLVARKRWTPERKAAVMNNISWTVDYGDLKDVPLVIECVFEDLALKKKILARVQEINPNAIFASNTSTLPMAEIGQGAIRPEQVVGMHYFSPVPLMPLLEIIQGPNSSPQAVATAVTSGRAMGKTLILVGDGPGFYTSRTFGNFVMNGLRLAELGLSPWDVDLFALKAGFPQGPLHIYGTAGGNVIYHAGKFLSERFPDRIKLSPTLEKLYQAGYVGAGKPCFYTDSRKMTPDQSVLEHVVPAYGLPKPTEEEAADVLLLGMVNEAFWCVSDGVLRDYYSMDLGAVLGIGFPDCRHGPARYTSIRGIKAVKARLMELADKFEMPALAPAPEFDALIACGLDSGLV